MIKAVLFDVDGVLVNGELFSVRLFKDYGIKIPAAFFEGEFEDALTGRKDLKIILEPKLEQWGWKKSVDELVDYWLNTEQEIDSELIEIIKNLKKEGIRCFIVTNQEKYRAEFLARELEFDNLFDGFFASGNVGFKKPQKEFFKYVLDSIELKGEEVLYFDDSPGYLEGARSLGINAYLYTGAEDLLKVLIDHAVRKESE